MVHHGQRLPLGLEAGDHLPGIHARLDDLQSHLAADGLLLFGQIDDAHAPCADLLQQLVGANLCPRTLHCGRLQQSRHGTVSIQQAIRFVVCPQQNCYTLKQHGVPGTLLANKGFLLIAGVMLHSFQEDSFRFGFV